jgi:hypothetical protein
MSDPFGFGRGPDLTWLYAILLALGVLNFIGIIAQAFLWCMQHIRFV